MIILEKKHGSKKKMITHYKVEADDIQDGDIVCYKAEVRYNDYVKQIILRRVIKK